MEFELTNDQRLYFGLSLIEKHWERIVLKGDSYRPNSILYFDGDVVKRHIVSTGDLYEEKQYDDLTKNRTILLPKTGRGKEQKLSASVVESRKPGGVYCKVNYFGEVFIGNFNTQTTFYDTRWEKDFAVDSARIEIKAVVNDFIETAPAHYLKELNEYKNAKRNHCKFKAGDFFVFKINRTHYGFGRILADIDKLKKSGKLSPDHGLSFIMAKPVLVKIYAYLAETKNPDLSILLQSGSLPSDYMMDNLLLYGQFEIIGHQKLGVAEIDFPISYGRHLGRNKFASFFQWGLIHREISPNHFDKYLVAENPYVAESSPSRKVSSPFRFSGVGFYPKWFSLKKIENAIANNGIFDYSKNPDYNSQFDLRNPANSVVRKEIMRAFGLDPAKDYAENCKLTGTIDF